MFGSRLLELSFMYVKPELGLSAMIELVIKFGLSLSSLIEPVSGPKPEDYNKMCGITTVFRPCFI